MGVRREYMKHKAWKQIPYTNNLEADVVDRDRLGFDEDSFKGEFYHGQKRKKKNNK